MQVIKKGDDTFGRLEFGTEIVSARDNTVAALIPSWGWPLASDAALASEVRARSTRLLGLKTA